jgi:hypothetical protein
LAGATVEVLDGPQAGMSTITGPTGDFSLVGNFDDATRFRASRDGYIAAIHVGAEHWMTYFLAVPAPPVNIAGEYSMTFTSARCVNLPSELQTRTYQATIAPGSYEAVPPNMVFNLALDGAEVLENPSIGVAGEVVGFKLFNDGYPYIVEPIARNVYVAVTGWAEVSSWPTGGLTITVPFEGWVEYWDAHPRSGRGPRVSCQSKDHRLTLKRR